MFLRTHVRATLHEHKGDLWSGRLNDWQPLWPPCSGAGEGVRLSGEVRRPGSFRVCLLAQLNLMPRLAAFPVDVSPNYSVHQPQG